MQLGIKHIVLKTALFFLCLSCGVHVFAQFDFPVEVQYDSAWVYKNLKLIPVRFTGDKGNEVKEPPQKLMNLSDAMKHKRVSVKELISKEGSERSVLVIKNSSDNSIVVNAGEVVTGGKQDRMIAETTIIPPSKEKQYVNVYCVEKGRWDKKPKAFQYHKPADHRLKRLMNEKRSQHEIWKAIDERYKEAGMQSETWGYKNVSKASGEIDTGYINFFTRKFIESDRNFAGFIAVTGDEIIEVNLYSSTDMQAVQFSTDLMEYVEVVIREGSAPVINNSKIENFIRPIFADEKTRNKFLDKHGRVFTYQGKIIHIVAYGD